MKITTSLVIETEIDIFYVLEEATRHEPEYEDLEISVDGMPSDFLSLPSPWQDAVLKAIQVAIENRGEP